MAGVDNTNTIKGIIRGHPTLASDHAQLQVGAVPRAGARNLSWSHARLFFLIFPKL